MSPPNEPGVTPPDAPPRQPKFKALHVAGCPRTMLGKTCSCPNGTGYDTVEQATAALGKPQRLAGIASVRRLPLVQRVCAAEKSLHDSEMECLGMQGRVERAEAESARLREALVKCAVPLEALHADNLAGSQLIAPTLRPMMAEAVEAIRAAVGRPSEPRT